MSADQITMLDGATEPDNIEAKLGGGTLVAHSDRSPDKETENEDTVAAIPYGPNVVVLVVADGVGGLPGGKRASETAVLKLAESLHAPMTGTILLRTAILDGIGSTPSGHRLGTNSRIIAGNQGDDRWIPHPRFALLAAAVPRFAANSSRAWRWSVRTRWLAPAW